MYDNMILQLLHIIMVIECGWLLSNQNFKRYRSSIWQLVLSQVSVTVHVVNYVGED